MNKKIVLKALLFKRLIYLLIKFDIWLLKCPRGNLKHNPSIDKYQPVPIIVYICSTTLNQSNILKLNTKLYNIWLIIAKENDLINFYAE